MYLLLMFIAMLVHQRVHRMCLLFTHPNDLQFIANDISRRWPMSELHKHLRSMQSTQEFSRIFSMFFGKPNCSKANKQKNISPPPNPPKKQKNAKKSTSKKSSSHTFPPTNPTDPNQPTDNQPRNGQRPKGHHQWLRKRTQRGRQR